MQLTETAKAHVAMLFFSMFVAGTYALGNIAVPHVDGTALMALRFLISGILMGAIILIIYPPEKRKLTRVWRFLLLGTVFAIYFAALFEALAVTTAISTGAMFTLTPFLTAGFALLLVRQTTSPYVLMSLSVAAVGAIWVIFRGDINALLSFEVGTGEKIFFIGVVAHALYVPLVRLLDQGEPVPVFTFGVLIGGSIPLVAVSYPEIVATDWTSMPAIVWVTLAYVVIFATLITFALLIYGNKRLPGTKVMAYTYLVPSWVIAWNALLGRGFVDLSVQFGIGLTAVAMLMLLRG